MQIPKIPGDTGKILSGLQKKRDEFLGQDLSGEDKTTLESINFNALSVSGKIFSSRQSFVIQVENILNKLQLDHTRVAILEKHTHKDSNIQTITRISNTSDLIDIGGGVIYNTSIYTLSMDNLLVKLTITEMLLFESLFTAGGKILSRDDLLDILGDEGERDFRTIDMHIKRLRKKLGVFGLSEHLKTHTGLGYSWMGNEIKLDTLSAEDKISIGDDIFLLPNLGGIYFKTELMPLTKSAIVILQKILSAPQRVFSREKIQAILGIDREQDLRGVDTHIKRLRQKLENIQTGLGKSIITLSGEGYYWDDSKSKSKGHIVSQTLMLQRDETLRQNIQSSVSEVHIATPTSFTISTINPMKTPALNQTLFGDYKDTFQELSHPKNLECISAFDSGNQVVPFQKLKEIFGNNWRDSMKTLASFLINTGYFFAYDETEEYVYLNYRRKRDKNSVNQKILRGRERVMQSKL